MRSERLRYLILFLLTFGVMLSLFSLLGCGNEDSVNAPSGRQAPSEGQDPGDGGETPPPEALPQITLSDPQPATITAGSSTGAASTATVTDGEGNPLAGEVVTFAVSPASVAQVSPSTATTDASGQAQTTVTGLEAGQASVTASVSPAGAARITSAPVTVNVAPPQVTLVAGASEITASTPGSGGTEITATVLDQVGNVALKGIAVVFSSNLGTLSQTSTVTDAAGQATVTLTSTATGEATLTADALEVTSNAVQVTVAAAAVQSVSVTPSPSQIPPDGTTASTILVAAQDEFGNPVVGRATVSTTPGLGNLSADFVDLVGGEGSVTMVSSSTGEGLVTAVLDGVTGRADVVVVEDLTGEPASVQVSVVPETISVAGVGGTEVTTISLTVVDKDGNPIDDSGVFNNVRLEIVDAPGGGENIQGNTIADGPVTLTTVNGQVSAGFQSGIRPGTVRIQVSIIKNKNGTLREPPLTAVVPQITIQAGPPFSLVLSRSNAISDNQDGTLTHEYLAVVSDQYGNNVPDGTSVFFGQIFEIVATERADGEVTAGSEVFTSVGADFSDVSAGDTLIIFDDDSIQKGGYLVSAAGADTLTVLTPFETDEQGLRYVVGNNRGGGVLSAGAEVTTTDGVARWGNTYPGELVNSSVYIYAETAGRTVSDARPFDLAWVAPTIIVAAGIPSNIPSGLIVPLVVGITVQDSARPTHYLIPDRPYAVSTTGGPVGAFDPSNIRTTPRIPENKDPGGVASFVWTVGPLGDGDTADLFVSAGGTTERFTVTGKD